MERWKQRLGDFKKAHVKLQEGLNRSEIDELIRDAIIKRFEFTFELAWKTLKDYLEEHGVMDAANPKKVIRKTFQEYLLINDEIWLKMLEDRNTLSHNYNQKMSESIYVNIKENYCQALGDLITTLEKEL
jgi:nucleotidyltransferase substrate binding protein (TIGR01987 family)